MPVNVDEQFGVTIWRLLTNTEYQTTLFGLGISTVCEIVHRTWPSKLELCIPGSECMKRLATTIEI